MITTGCVVASAALSWYLLWNIFSGGEGTNIIQSRLFPWIAIGDFKVFWGIRVDMLSAAMLAVVSTVSSLVHIYSFGYMHSDPGQPRFFCYLSMFTAFMMVLVVSDNFLQMFFGWEGVGLCSYLLIGFWFQKDAANSASIKAFMVNRLADCGFVLGMFAIYHAFGSLNFEQVFVGASSYHEKFHGIKYIDFICICLLIGCMGKSAQIGFHVWLPDAMEGPTPVSALIHAATMVTAGIFLIIRCAPLFEYAELARMTMTAVGAVTCFFGAAVAIGQKDIKKVIAYSTCSQLGYMVFACGVSAYGVGMFHLVTHAFFKSLLFLGAGSIIHALGGEQDLSKMGGIRRKMPLTFAFMLVGSFSIAGIFPFSGYFSKDLILEAAYAHGSAAADFAFALGLVSVFLTAYYSFRLLNYAFFGESRYAAFASPHEPPASMLFPLVVLTLFSLSLGYLGHRLGVYRNNFWDLHELGNATEEGHGDYLIRFLPTLLSIAGIFFAFMLAKRFFTQRGLFADFMANKWYFDEIYNFMLVKPMILLSRFCGNVFDRRIIDGLGPKMIAKISYALSGYITKIHVGYIFNYAFVMVIGIIFLISWIMNNYFLNVYL
ncbi:NADH:ubiquinone oxidoreductase subunit L [Rickettsiales bacterium]|nr:NADH:ubiquinone oxidoreductase subunit L [Rickettsiales bacterium]